MKKNTSYIMICLISTMLLIGCNRNPGKTVEEKIDFVINSAYQRGEFVGSALVAKQGKIVYQKNFGWSDKNNTDTISDSTKFLIASVTKPITAILILKLAEDGKLKLTDSIGKLFKILDTSKLAGVTVHQLLTHTSGIEELLSEKHELTEVGLEQARFAFDPGTDFKYSNTGYVILKLIAEKVSSTSYKELVTKQIFEPLHMKSTGVAYDQTALNHLAIGYSNAAQDHPVKIGYPLKLVDGAGSIYSTVQDLYKLDRALYTNQLLSTNSRLLMQQQHVKEKYGYGWFLRERGGVWDVMYQSGDLPGFSSFISRRTVRDEVIILLSNSEGLDLDDLENDISRILKSVN